MKRTSNMMAVSGALCVLACQAATPVQATPGCVWRGTAPFCDGECEAGETPSGRDKDGDGETCHTGTKVLCCSVAVFCNDYAQTAVAWSSESQRLGCGNGGPRWSNDISLHLNWCMAVAAQGNRSEPNSETVARDVALASCRKRATFCNDYANKAAAAASENQKLNCGNGGPRWSTAVSLHLNWCMALNGDQAPPNTETAARAGGLTACREEIAQRENLGQVVKPGKAGDILKQVAPKIATAKNNAAIHKGPSAKDQVIGTMFKGEKAPVVSQKGDWYRLKGVVAGANGWVAADQLTVSP